MKKLALTLSFVMAVCAVFAAPEKFISWKLSDVSVIKAQLAKPNESVPAYQKVWYKYLLAKIESPESVSTLAKCEQVLDAAKAQYSSTVGTPIALLTVLWNTRDKRFLAEIPKDAKYTSTDFYRRNYVLGGWVTASVAEKRDIALEFAEKEIKRGKTATVASLVDKYVEFSLDDDDAVVVKGLQKLYRLASPKLTAAANDPWKPIVAKLQLALKSRGADVK